MSITVLKADGSSEFFRAEKLRHSLRRAGASKDEIASIVTQIETTIYDGIRTQEIYRQAFELLRKSEQPVSARYAMRRALLGLGPTGFPFEDFLAKLFTREGYTTKTRVILQGKCAEHELDVAAYNEHRSFVAEAKFHSRPGVKSDLQVALYSFARLMDLKEARICNEDQCGITELLLVTNTKFTASAESYAACSGLTLLSWDYPKHNNLHDRIQRVGIYPVTVLQSITPTQKRQLIELGIITCRDLIEHPHALRRLHVSAKRIAETITEAEQLITIHKTA